MISILLVDDQPSVRRGLQMRLALEPDVAIIGEAGDGAVALDLARTLRPDVVVMDIEMPTMDGLAATRALSLSDPHPAVVMLSIYDDAAMRHRAMAAGAVAFVGKHEAADVLPQAIRQAVQSSA